jgi:glutathione S-transferase
LIRFYAETFAPWCERARWALDHHGVAYREIAQLPLVTELTARIGARRMLRRATLPMLVGEGTFFVGSDDIARYAEAHGGGAPLFAGGVDEWMATSEALMVAGRAMLLPRVAQSRAALRAHARPAWLASLGVRHLMRKYAVRAGDHEAISRVCLDRLRAATIANEFLVGARFSYADLTMAAALQFVMPVDGWIALGPAMREAWTNHALAREYGDVLAWRDRRYAQNR